MKLYKATAEGTVEFSEEDYRIFEADRAALPSIKSSAVRSRRNDFLAATDWAQGADVPQAIKDKWSAYRQALRDVPQQAGFPDNIQWPSKPE
jgi:hypothetical protein